MKALNKTEEWQQAIGDQQFDIFILNENVEFESKEPSQKLMNGFNSMYKSNLLK